MLNKTAYKIALAGLLVSLSGTASALGDQWYLGIGGGVSTLKPDIVDTSIDTSDEKGQTGTIFIGRDFDNRSSGQLQLYSLGEAEYQDGQGNASYTAGDASLLYRFYDTRDTQPRGTLFGAALYGRFGFGFMQRDSDLELDTDTPVYFGAGAGIETYLTFNLALRLEALYHDTDATSATLTLVNRFGGRRHLAAPVLAPNPVRPAVETAPQTATDTQNESVVTSNTTQTDAIAIPSDLPETYVRPTTDQSTSEISTAATETTTELPETIEYDVPDSAGAPVDLSAQPGLGPDSGVVPGSTDAPIDLTPLPDLDDSDTAISQVPDEMPEEMPEELPVQATEQAAESINDTTSDISATADSSLPAVELMDDDELDDIESSESPASATVDSSGETANDFFPDVEIMGTPAERKTAPPADSDADGIADDQDRCADSTPGYPVTTLGCSAFGGIVPDLNFNDQTADLATGSYVVLDTLVEQLLDYPDTYIELIAHTDNTGTEAQQSELTRQRLRSIGVYLVRHGVSQERLLLRSYGGSRPIFDNKTAEGRRRNNRIEVLENP